MPRACFACAISLEDSPYYSKYGHSYCQSCYEVQFCPTCTKCNQKIKGEQKSLAWKNKPWHCSCFNCTKCMTSLVQWSSSLEHNSLPYCSKCYDESFSPKCSKCREVIEHGTSFIDTDAGRLHGHCFKCSSCNASLVKQSYYDHNGGSYCQHCDSQQFCPKCASCGGIIRRGTTYSKLDGQLLHNTCITCFACGQMIGQVYVEKNGHTYHSYCANNSHFPEKGNSFQKSLYNNDIPQNQAKDSHHPVENAEQINTNNITTITSSKLRSSRAKSTRSSQLPTKDSAHDITPNNSTKETSLKFTPQTSKRPQTSAPHHVSVISPFYNACRDNNIDLVEHDLETMSLEEINKIEPNGSTALHVASYRGHEKIVELLLQKGASHSIVNKYKSTPFDEAKTERIKQLIRGRINKTRFVSESVEWILSSNDADFQAHEYSKKIEAYGKDPHFYQLIIYIKENYLEKDLKHVEDIETIKQYFDMAIKQKDPLYLLKAYTAETGFYSALNLHLTELHLKNLSDNENLSRAYFTGIIAHHPKLQGFSYTGNVFRGMMITNNDFKQYKIGTRILTKTFSSASKQRNIALKFLNDTFDADDLLSTICTYEIRNQRTALDIQHISVYEYEQEVLVLPYSAFKIVDIQTNKHNSPKAEIKLKECEPW